MKNVCHHASDRLRELITDKFGQPGIEDQSLLKELDRMANRVEGFVFGCVMNDLNEADRRKLFGNCSGEPENSQRPSSYLNKQPDLIEGEVVDFRPKGDKS